MKYSSRFFLYAPMGLFLALVLGVSIHWWVVASAFSARLAAMNGHEIAPGVTMHYASRTISGFPFTLDTVFREMNFEIATPHGPTRWHADKFAMHALTYGREETIFEAAGPQQLSWTRDDGSIRTLVFAVGSLHASAIEDRTGLIRFDLDLVGFGSKALTAQRLQFHIRRDKDDKLDLAILADGIHTTVQNKTTLGNQIVSMRLDGTISAAHAFDTLRTGGERWYKALEKWRLAQGNLRVGAASFERCGVKFNGRGSLSLDDTHRLKGPLEFRITNLSELLGGAAREHRPHVPRVGEVSAPGIGRGCPAQPVINDGMLSGYYVDFADALGPLY